VSAVRAREERAPAWRGERPLRVGISSCLLGEKVRWDGGHKRNAFLVSGLGRFVEWLPVCPEVEVGMGIPRPSVRLVRDGDEVRMLEHATDRDHTRAMRAFVKRRVAEIAELDLCGYVLKKDSPSCGMERVKVYRAGEPAVRDGRGLFAQALLAALPSLPVEEEGRLHDAALRENFIERVFAYRRLRDLFASDWRLGDVIAFHTAHKLQLMAHAPKAYAELGRLVAGMKRLPRAELRSRYETDFMAALAKRATPGRNANVLEHMVGHVSERLDAAQRRELQESIRDYRGGLVPLVVPLTLVRHHARRFDVAYLLGQVYLDPHPKELMLRNHV
jgi:uncharacterized protein YbgA (DUF1722 family)/uncharacterized protein YbbK (DUF523 family)